MTEVNSIGDTIYVDDFALDNADWIRSARLARRSKAGDEEAAKELEERGRTKMVVLGED